MIFLQNACKTTGCLLAFISCLSPATAAEPVSPLTLTVQPEKRQTFKGFGTSQNNFRNPYSKLTPEQRERLSLLIWRDLGFRILRLWFTVPEYAPRPGERNTEPFVTHFVASRVIADAQKQGATTLLLAPDGVPPYMLEKRGDRALIRDEQIPPYAELLAGFIHTLKTKNGVRIDVTGIENEPENFTPEQMASAVAHLRAALDKKGLRSVKIIAPESANTDSHAYAMVDAMKGNPRAWRGLAGIATHSYNMAATEEMAKRIEGTGKEYWMTEASRNGPEEPGDALQAASMASRFLNDMNHRVTHWLWFLGYEENDPNDDATRILRYRLSPFSYDLFQKYYYFRQLTRAFPPGSVFRDTESSLEGDMTWTYGKKPRITAAAAQTRGGRWGIGISNYTSDSFTTGDEWNRTQEGHPAQAFAVTVRVKELQGKGNRRFRLYRSSGSLKNVDQGIILMKDGSVSVTVNPLELVTLVSDP
ncbi:MAG: hypothetical protein KY468_12790 [Armatimonadetes bacterium]|nr:hypothetical protein [Armatimonadota bacterium]